MPIVNGKHYPYTAKGKKAAAKAKSMKGGKRMEKAAEKMMFGGRYSK